MIDEHDKKTWELIGKVRTAMENVLNHEKLVSTARRVGFVQRVTSRIQGYDFVKLLTVEALALPNISLPGMCDILRNINPEADMTPQALSQRINNGNAVNYLKEVLRLALQENLKLAEEKSSPSLLAPFNRVFLEDSTGMSLHEKLADEFRGSGGSASKAALKINLIYDFKGHVIQELSITHGTVPDQSRAGAIVDLLEKADLVIRDLGYFSVKSLADISAKKAFFLSRLLKQVAVYLCPESNAPAVDLVNYLDKKFPNQSMIDLDIYLGQERLPCRLIVYRAPEVVINERIRKANANANKKGRQLSNSYKQWLKFTFFVTNVSREVWPPDVIGTIYRLRWQIELTFKSWKSLCHIHMLKGERPERIECLVYGRLIAIVLIVILYGFASWYSENQLQREASLHKLIEWLNRKERLSKAVLSCELNALLRDLIHDLPRILCKQERKRKTTLQLIESQVPFGVMYPDEDDQILPKAA
jgi:hypothetical protein